ncbi:hypothetical protein BO71DRAFT_395884 [Aspergillus ellipticus CBS 707.79]|uniref:DUF1279 domain-containing protein n=1 Tax=Aspergillus ellipticus CBS 707.79 TaxID=1448320 RepID=A0A319EAK4_9EURO|nr:hypothetical protein BO71DRAFT_395884 [Aspergillus ellipticus CBS 707.79]
MNIRHHYLRRWLLQKSIFAQHAPPSPIVMTNIAKHRTPSASIMLGRTLRTRTFQNQSLPSGSIVKGGRAQNFAMLRRFFSSSRVNSKTPSGQQSSSLSQRLRTLSKEYGWSALWIYLLLSAMDFPFCFAAVRLLGVERIGHYEHVFFESVKLAANSVWPGSENVGSESGESKDSVAQVDEESADTSQQQTGGEEASLWTQLALAYAIHKSFIFVRVPLTAAITPKVVRVLRHWGWDIVKGRPKGM